MQPTLIPSSSNVPSTPGASAGSVASRKTRGAELKVYVDPSDVRPIFGVACAEEDTKEIFLNLNRSWQGGAHFVPEVSYRQDCISSLAVARACVAHMPRRRVLGTLARSVPRGATTEKSG